MFAARRLASYVSAFPSEKLTRETKDKVFCCILDAVTAVIAGYDTPAAAGTRQAVPGLYGTGSYPIWFSGQTASAAAAVTCNAVAASALDLDDGHRDARGHPGAAIIPAVLTLASQVHADRDDILAAIALGYEIGVRIAAAQNPSAIKSRQSGRWVGYGVVAAAARLCLTQPEQLSHAFAIAGVLAPNQDANGSSGYAKLTGNDVKEGIPWATVTGLTALAMARRGLTGPEDILDHASHFDTVMIVADLNEPRTIERTYFKPYSCCRYIHPAIDAYLDLAAHQGVTALDVERIEVQTFAWALKLGNRTVPQNVTDIQYSLPYCLAIAALDGAGALAPVGAHHLGRRDLADFALRIKLSADTALDRRFPAETLARVTVVKTTGEPIVSPVTIPRGDTARPMRWDDICNKFLTVTAAKLSSSKQAAILDSLVELRKGNVARFIAHLASTPDG